MQNDAKLGLLAGTAAVILSAVVYFPKPEEKTAAQDHPKSAVARNLKSENVEPSVRIPHEATPTSGIRTISEEGQP